MKHEYVVVTTSSVDIGGLVYHQGDILCSCEIGLFARFLVRNNVATIMCPTKANIAACRCNNPECPCHLLKEDLGITRVPSCLAKKPHKFCDATVQGSAAS